MAVEQRPSCSKLQVNLIIATEMANLEQTRIQFESFIQVRMEQLNNLLKQSENNDHLCTV